MKSLEQMIEESEARIELRSKASYLIIGDRIELALLRIAVAMWEIHESRAR